MKIFIMTDMEGCAGILNHDDWVMPDSRYYEKGRRILTEEINAAIDGLAAGGATIFHVVDGHGAGGIDPELLDERAELSRGHREKIWPWGLDETYDGVAFVGQHAKAGTPYSHITHTGWFSAVDVSVNGVSIGEYGNMALCAMELGVPTILACGEKALGAEAEALTPGVVTVAVKEGLLPDGLEHLTTDQYRAAKLSAVHISPKLARERIRKGAREAMQRLRADRSAFGYVEMSPPYTLVGRYRADGEKPPFTMKARHPDSIIGLFNTRSERVEEG